MNSRSLLVDPAVPARGSPREMLEMRVVDQGTLDTLFAVLFLTSFGSLVAGNVLLLNAEVLKTSTLVWIPCFGLLIIFYAFSRLMKGVLQGLVAVLGLAALLVWLRQPWVVPLFYLLVVAALAYTAIRMRPRGARWWSVILMSISGVAVCFSAFSLFNCFDNLNMARAGMVHKDVFFHSAMAAMIKNYGVASTGLHGVVEVPYYVLSHFLVALLSSASGVGVFEVYGILSYVFFIPLLIFSVCLCSLFLSGSRAVRLEICWAVVCLMFVLPKVFLSKWLVTQQFLMSESYVLSISLFALGLPLLWKGESVNSDAVLAVIATGAMCWAKVTTGMIYAGLLGARWLVLTRGRGTRELLAACASLGLAALFACDVSVWASAFSQSRFAFMEKSWGGAHLSRLAQQMSSGHPVSVTLILKASAAVTSFLLLHFILSWLVLGMSIKRKGWKALLWGPAVVSTWASLLPAVLAVVWLTYVHPSASYWFTNPPFFVALPPFVASLTARVGQVKDRTVLVVVLAMIGATSLASYRSYYKKSVLYPLHSARHKSALIDALVAVRKDSPFNAVLKAPPEAWQFQPVLKGVLAHLGLTRAGAGWRKEPWKTAAPLVYPAISERAWMGVIAPNESTSRYDSYNSYGYPCYDIDRANGGVRTPPVLLPGMEIVDWAVPGDSMREGDNKE